MQLAHAVVCTAGQSLELGLGWCDSANCVGGLSCGFDPEERWTWRTQADRCLRCCAEAWNGEHHCADKRMDGGVASSGDCLGPCQGPV